MIKYKRVIPDASGVYQNWEHAKKNILKDRLDENIKYLTSKESNFEEFSAFTSSDGNAYCLVKTNFKDPSNKTLGSDSHYLISLPKLGYFKDYYLSRKVYNQHLFDKPMGDSSNTVNRIFFCASPNKTSNNEVILEIIAQNDVTLNICSIATLGGIINIDDFKNAKTWQDIANNLDKLQKEEEHNSLDLYLKKIKDAIVNTKKLIVEGEESYKKEEELKSKITQNSFYNEQQKRITFNEFKNNINSDLNKYVDLQPRGLGR